jgi:hypothetical protein
VILAGLCEGQSDSMMYVNASNYIFKSKKIKRACRKAFLRLSPSFRLENELLDGFNVSYIEQLVKDDTLLLKVLNNYPIYSKPDTLVNFPNYQSLQKLYEQRGRCVVRFSKPHERIMKIQLNELRGKDRQLDEFVIVIGLFVFDERSTIKSFYFKTIHAD